MVKLVRLETREKPTRDNDSKSKGTILYQNEKLEILVTEVDRQIADVDSRLGYSISME